VRAASMTGMRYTVQPQWPADGVGIYVLLPMPEAAGP